MSPKGLFDKYVTPRWWVVLKETDLSLWQFNMFFLIRRVTLGGGGGSKRQFQRDVIIEQPISIVVFQF